MPPTKRRSRRLKNTITMLPTKRGSRHHPIQIGKHHAAPKKSDKSAVIKIKTSTPRPKGKYQCPICDEKMLNCQNTYGLRHPTTQFQCSGCTSLLIYGSKKKGKSSQKFDSLDDSYQFGEKSLLIQDGKFGDPVHVETRGNHFKNGKNLVDVRVRFKSHYE